MKYRVKVIDDNIYLKKGDIFLLFREKNSSRKVSWITLNQITKEYPDFFDKIEEIFTISNPCYNDRSKKYATSIMEYIELFGFISWKQFDSVWNICRTYNDYIEGKDKGYYTYGSVVSLRSKNVKLSLNKNYLNNQFLFTGKKLTDKDLDRISTQLFGSRCMAEEDEEGLALTYDDDGNRCWSLPTSNESIYDFI
jgi:hypothetical protein